MGMLLSGCPSPLPLHPLCFLGTWGAQWCAPGGNWSAVELPVFIIQSCVNMAIANIVGNGSSNSHRSAEMREKSTLIWHPLLDP